MRNIKLIDQNDSTSSFGGGGKNRIEWMDSAKGICIILVVLDHISQFLNYDSVPGLASFRMPLYFMLSGIFFKTYDSFNGFCIRKINKLLIPYLFFFTVLSCIVPWLLCYCGILWYPDANNIITNFSYIFNEHKFPNTQIWFLQCLFEINIFFFFLNYLMKHVKILNRDLLLLAFSYFIGFFGLLLCYTNIHIPFYIDSALTALPLFSTGWYLKNNTDIFTSNKHKKYYIPFFIVSIIFIYYFRGCSIHFINNFFSFENYGINIYLCGVMGTLSVFIICKCFRRIPIITYFGRYSIIILCTHPFIYLTVDSLLGYSIPSQAIKTFVYLVLTMFSYFVLIPFFKEWLPYFVAQKDLIKIR